ncbi:MAG: UDP-N-acetylenolpyruvoylglucosamine reductase, partial [Balneolaceae bacterium]
IGNTGSFFKNPVISTREFEKLYHKYPEIPHYPSGEDVKIPAAWLIDQCGWKGKRFGDAGVHKMQALVIVNYGNATGTEIWELAQRIQKSVEERFGVSLTPEVNIVS